jgi:hypothetical protein
VLAVLAVVMGRRMARRVNGLYGGVRVKRELKAYMKMGMSGALRYDTLCTEYALLLIGARPA